MICSTHVYDQSEYENSYVAETDIGTCGDYGDDWPLYPIITRYRLQAHVEMLLFRDCKFSTIF